MGDSKSHISSFIEYRQISWSRPSFEIKRLSEINAIHLAFVHDSLAIDVLPDCTDQLNVDSQAGHVLRNIPTYSTQGNLDCSGIWICRNQFLVRKTLNINIYTANNGCIRFTVSNIAFADNKSLFHQITYMNRDWGSGNTEKLSNFSLAQQGIFFNQFQDFSFSLSH